MRLTTAFIYMDKAERTSRWSEPMFAVDNEFVIKTRTRKPALKLQNEAKKSISANQIRRVPQPCDFPNGDHAESMSLIYRALYMPVALYAYLRGLGSSDTLSLYLATTGSLTPISLHGHRPPSRFLLPNLLPQERHPGELLCISSATSTCTAKL